MKYIIAIILCFSLLPASGQLSTSVMQHLNGRWISEDDKQFVIVLKGSTKKVLYGGKVESTYRYRTRNDSLVAKDVNNGDVFNYAIMRLTDNHLTLMYLDRGNLLKFQKQPAANAGSVKKRSK